VDICDTAQIFVSARVIDKNVNGTKELIDLKLLYGKTQCTDSFKSYNLDRAKLDSLCTDAPAMVGEAVGISTLIPSHGKSSNISCFMNTAVKCVNKIRECGLHYQKFKEYYKRKNLDN
jgi:hypothetical protein